MNKQFKKMSMSFRFISIPIICILTLVIFRLLWLQGSACKESPTLFKNLVPLKQSRDREIVDMVASLVSLGVAPNNALNAAMNISPNDPYPAGNPIPTSKPSLNSIGLAPHRLSANVRPACTAMSPMDFKKNTNMHGQWHLDVRMKRWITGSHGFFIESGAYDGITFSNTYIFSELKCWTGLLIEPSPNNARNARAVRPNEFVVHAALVGPEFPNKTIKGNFNNSPMSSANKNGIVEVPARTLSDILDELRVDHVHWWSLDIEGFELSALRGLNFSRWMPDYILIELWNNNTEIYNLLAGHGYVVAADITPWSWFSAHRDILFSSPNAAYRQPPDESFPIDNPWYTKDSTGKIQVHTSKQPLAH